MKKFYIPEIGDEITLAADWKFTLYPETRNVKLGRKMGVCKEEGDFGSSVYFSDWLDKPNGKNIGSHPQDWDQKNEKWVWKVTYPLTLPKGTKLKIDRIYIRKGKGMKEYSSITFWIKSGLLKGVRFWARLTEVNEIHFTQCTQAKLQM